MEDCRGLLIHIACGEIPLDDYRKTKEDRFVQHQHLHLITYHARSSSEDGNDSSLDLENTAIESIAHLISSKEYQKVYVSVSSLDVKSWMAFFKALCAHIQQSSLSSHVISLILLEDLIYLERSYVYENKHRNFFKHFLSLSEQFTGVSTILSSTNEVMNSWGQGDCHIIKVPELIENPEYYWQQIQSIEFHEMFNQGNAVPRLISIQSINDPVLGRPLYRHPNDQEPPNIEMQPIVRELLDLVTKYSHCEGINHVLIQHYRDGKDNIAAHSDKTLDISLDCPIINLTLGCSRDFYLQSKDNKKIFEKIPLRHGELLILGLETNRYWYHEIPKDVTMDSHPLYQTSRVSFTFRKIMTFYQAALGVVVGQGSPYKSIEEVGAARVGAEPEERMAAREQLISAFSKENRQSAAFNWDECYGSGFLIH